jgi:hypothetical protein
VPSFDAGAAPRRSTSSLGAPLRRRHLLALLLAFTLVSACKRTITLTIPDSAPLKVNFPRENQSVTLASDSEEYKQLALWIESNRSGWSPYYVTTPGGGIVVTGGNWRLQFLDSSVLAETDTNVYSKSVAPSEYKFLSLLSAHLTIGSSDRGVASSVSQGEGR